MPLPGMSALSPLKLGTEGAAADMPATRLVTPRLLPLFPVRIMGVSGGCLVQGSGLFLRPSYWPRHCSAEPQAAERLRQNDRSIRPGVETALINSLGGRKAETKFCITLTAFVACANAPPVTFGVQNVFAFTRKRTYRG